MQNDISRQWAFLTPFVPGEMLTAQAKQIESLGMAGIFVPEIYSDPFMGMGFVAAVTERLKVASGIKIAWASNPFEIAMTAMDLDRLSGGRVVLGLGTSVKTWVEGFHGQAGYGKPVAHLRESIQVIREVFAKSHIPGRAADVRRRIPQARLADIPRCVRPARPGDDPHLGGGQPDRPHPPGG